MTDAIDTRSFGRRWLDFWFSAADPSTLGFMRIVTGVLVVYIHLTYSFDLQSFFGKDGWYGLKEVNAERTSYPFTMENLDWEDKNFIIPGYIPEQAHRRKAVVEWYRKLGEMTPAERKTALAYVQRVQDNKGLNAAREGLQFAERIPQNELVRKHRLDMIVKPEQRVVDVVPGTIEVLSEKDRIAMRGELDEFLKCLPADPDHRTYVMNHLTEINGPQRQLLLEFLYDMPEDAAARAEQLEYLAYWNNEKRKAGHLGFPIFSIWFHVTDPTEMAIAHGVILVIMVMFTIGLFTRVTSVLTWLAAVSYIHRTTQVLFGMDTMMNLLLISLMIGPSGAAMSVDRWRARRKAERLSRLRNNGELDAATQRFLAMPPKTASAGFVLRLVQIQFCFIYMSAGLSKLKGYSWWNHDAFWDTVANPEFTMMHFPFYEKMMREFVRYRPVYEISAAIVVKFTLFMELALPFLVWTKLRPYMVIGGVLFHFGIGMFMGLNLFGLLMMTLLLAYIPGEVIRKQLFTDVKS